MESRTRNSRNNIITGLLANIIGIILPFINRTVILYTLGYEYQGLNTLFTSILSTLSLAELGMSAAVVFCMYRAVAENDIIEQCALLNFFRKVYFVIGMVIFLFGIILVPFLPLLIKGQYPSNINIYFLFFLFLIQTCVTYWFFGYKSIIFSANQKEAVVNKVQMLVTTIRYTVQFFILILSNSFYLYVVASIAGNILQNAVIAFLSKREYPELICVGSITKERKSELKGKISGLFLNRISNEIRNSSDNITISLFLGLQIVASYGNYYYIMNAIYCMFGIIVRGMSASVGNSVVIESIDKNYRDFHRFGFLLAFLNSVATCCMFSIFQPFIYIWAGKELVLANSSMILFCMYFYMMNVNNPINLYFETNGLWNRAKHLFILSAIFNLILNFILCVFIGINGILIATIFSIVLFSIIGRLKLLYNNYFREYKMTEFLGNEMKYFSVTIVACLTSFLLNMLLDVEGIAGIILGLAIAVATSLICWYLFFRKSKYFSESITFIKRLIKRD